MLTAADIKRIKSLKDKKFRDELGLFVVEGEKMVAEAMTSGMEVVERYTVAEIGEKAMERITHLASPSFVLCVVRKPKNLHKVPERLRKGGLYIALDSLRDPGNLGTILRIADWYGIDGVFASEDSVDVFNPKVVQSTMGAIFRVDFRYCDIRELCSRGDAEVFGTFLHGDNIYTSSLEAADGKARIIVTGNESNGISAAVAMCCDRKITIPSFAKGNGSESLNAAVATAITVSEFKRRTL